MDKWLTKLTDSNHRKTIEKSKSKMVTEKLLTKAGSIDHEKWFMKVGRQCDRIKINKSCFATVDENWPTTVIKNGQQK